MDIDKKIINGIRALSIDMINEAKSGHPGICLGAAPTIYTLFNYHLNFNPEDGEWINRDRFILSAGHGSALLYSTLFFAGYPIKSEELKTFRQIGSRLTGHPELNKKIGIEVTTGPLGEGFATSIGIAIAEEYLKNQIDNKLFNHFTYVLVGDGDLMEGISYEAMSLAGSLKLGNLIVLYDSNDVSLDGPTYGVFNEDVLKRFESCGWHTQEVSNGEDYKSINAAISKAKEITDKPSIIKIKTILGIGTNIAGTNEAHGKPLSEENIELVKTKMGVKNVPFYISKEAVETFRNNIENRCIPVYNKWVTLYNEFMSKDSVNKKIVQYLESGKFKINLKTIKVKFEEGQKEELRITNGKLLNLISNLTPLIVGGSADVSSSTKAYITQGKDFKINAYNGRNIHFGVRENLMSSVLNGLALCGLRPFGSTFLAFSDYMKPGIRLSAMMNLPVTYIFTHDSVRIGEDGPTHQPIEQLGNLRSIPNFKVFRPSDVKELVGSWDYIINNPQPSALIITKEKLPEIQTSDISNVEKGGYIIRQEKGRLSGVIVSTGEDVHTAIEISELLNRKGLNIRVVSMPCVELFNNQPKEYKEELLPIGAKVIALESSNDRIWNELVYNKKYLLTINTFGISGKKNQVLKEMEFDVDTLAQKVEKLLK